MCDNGYGHIAIGLKSVGLNDDNIDKVLGEAKEKRLVTNSSKKEKAKAIGEGIIYLNPHLNNEQKGRIREKFNDKELEDITELDLEGFGLEALPESIGDLENLWYLNLNNNKLSALPDSIGGLKNLQALHLSSNKLSALPDSFVNLGRLVMLGLDNNQLEKLPYSFEKLTALARLCLDNNKLRVLPHPIRDLTELSARNNPLKPNFNKIPKSYLSIEGETSTIEGARGL